MRFAVWAPNAERVSVVGDFNHWDGRARIRCTSRGASGVWELFMPELPAGTLYKYEIRDRASGAVLVKADPYAHSFELRPGNGGAGHDAGAASPGATREWIERRARGTGCTRR